MRYLPAILAAYFLLFKQDFAWAQTKAPKVFLLEDVKTSQWCSYLSESNWKAKVQHIEAMTVGAAIYSNDHLTEIDVSMTDESGDWTVYDHYLLDDHGQIVKLERLLNVLPGDTSTTQIFSISHGIATKTANSEKQLSTGKPLSTPSGAWLPELTIRTDPKRFPFSALLTRPDLRISPQSCAKVSTAR
jgi:hypothetical protein